eukprot:TRINITY_DN36940_c0_g1_i2.p1 TRINITY_DN36940_c0_g1~~TRINITY_DN36940_c0_g1_i2.p1  ORF type:complete len:118 (-),score=29.51 TRINITY_DN36940_c0_g1_i2:176-529(-)
MCDVAASELPLEQKNEMACCYAALLLQSEKKVIDKDSISKLVTAAGVKVPPYLPKMFEDLFRGKDVAALLKSASTPGGGVAAAGGGTAPCGKAAEAPPVKEEEEEEDDGDMGMGLFD